MDRVRQSTVHGVTELYMAKWLTHTHTHTTSLGLPKWCSVKESACQCKRSKTHELDPWVRKIPWSKKQQSTPVLLPGKFYRQRSLVGYSPWSHKNVGHEWVTEHARMQCYWTSVISLSQILFHCRCFWYNAINIEALLRVSFHFSSVAVMSDSVLQGIWFSSVTESCPTLCDPIDCCTPGLPVHHQLPEFTQTYVHWVSDAI